jgi:hypothetical protein
VPKVRRHRDDHPFQQLHPLVLAEDAGFDHPVVLVDAEETGELEEQGRGFGAGGAQAHDSSLASPLAGGVLSCYPRQPLFEEGIT